MTQMRSVFVLVEIVVAETPEVPELDEILKKMMIVVEVQFEVKSIERKTVEDRDELKKLPNLFFVVVFVVKITIPKTVFVETMIEIVNVTVTVQSCRMFSSSNKLTMLNRYSPLQAFR